MKKFTSKKTFIPLFTIEANDVPSEVIPKEVKVAYVLDGSGKLWSWNRTSMHSTLSPISLDKKNDILKNFEDLSFLNHENCFLYDSQWSSYSFFQDEFKYVMAYFRAIYDKYQTEAAVLLLVNNTTKQWKVFFVPQVDCSGGGVNYLMPQLTDDGLENRTKERFNEFMKIDGNAAIMEKCYEALNKLKSEGYTIYGTIHSHCNFSAYHSSVDDADEAHFDGLHITIGNVRSGWSFSSRMMLNGAGFQIDIFDTFKWNKDELMSDIDNIAIDEGHMALMQPEVGKPKFSGNVVSFYNRGNSSESYGFQRTFPSYNSDEDFNLFSGRDIPNDDDEFLSSIIYTDAAVHLFDLKAGDGLYVKSSYFFKNKSRFPEERFVMLDDTEYSDELTAKSNEFNLLLEKQLEAVDNEIYLIHDNRLGPKNKNYKGELIEDIDAFIKTHRKATKIR